MAVASVYCSSDFESVMQTIFWHDYETFGADPSRDRPCQFAGVRTDLELNVIEVESEKISENIIYDSWTD